MKILVVLNGLLTPQHVVDSAINIATTTSSFLHSVFVNYAVDLAEFNYPFPNDLSLTRNNLTGKTIAEENAELLESNMQLFKDECKAAKVDYYRTWSGNFIWQVKRVKCFLRFNTCRCK